MRPPPSRSRSFVELALAKDHEELELLYQRLLTSLHSGDSERIRRRWLALDAALEEHLRAEEEFILSQFERDRPVEAALIRREHRQIRSHLVALGVDLDLHALCPASATRFIEALRRHAQSEEAVLYPWAHFSLSPANRLGLLSRLRGLTAPPSVGNQYEEQEPRPEEGPT
jgi:hypothetical protein